MYVKMRNRVVALIPSVIGNKSMSLSPFEKNNSLNIEQAILAGEAYLLEFDLVYGHGTANAMDEAAWLILEAMHLSPLEMPDYSKRLSNNEKRCAASYLELRAVKRQPAAYITGRTWFAGLEFYADERALIPRSPLAEPIMQGFSDFIDPTELTQVLDLCTGGGCIAIACAYAFADAHVDALDISPEALALAQKNIDFHQMNDRVRTIESDLFLQLEPKKQYDLIISNPPYVDLRDMQALGDEFKREPALGLAAGDDGLDIVRKIFNEACNHLAPSGILVCEVGNSAEALEQAFPGLPLLWLEFEFGGEGIFLVTRDELAEFNANNKS